MVDSLSPARRSWNMGRIRNRNTKPELLVRSVLHRLGYRFTINGPLNKRLPGRPDIVLPKHRTAIFVHGCFWHRHEGCRDTTTPKSRTQWWLEKFSGNVARDQKNQATLKADGWNVITVWECEVPKIGALTESLDQGIRRLAFYPSLLKPTSTAIAAEEPPKYGSSVEPRPSRRRKH